MATQESKTRKTDKKEQIAKLLIEKFRNRFKINVVSERQLD